MTSIRFSEEMKGAVTLGEGDFEVGARRGADEGIELMFHLNITIGDIDRFEDDPRRTGTATGWVRCEALGGRLPVERGSFNLFVDRDSPADKRMLYRLHFRDGVGHPLTLTGFKIVRDHPGWDMWPDTTKLFARVARGHNEAEDDSTAEPVAAGILRIGPVAFARLLATVRAEGGSAGARAGAVARFLAIFVGGLRDVYRPRVRRGSSESAAGAPAGTERSPRRSADFQRGARRGRSERGWPMRPGDHLGYDVVPFEAGDGMGLNLIHIRGERPATRGPVLLVHGAGVRANLFRSPVDTTLVEYLSARGHDVWLENWRASIDLPPNPWTLDQAAVHDHPRAVARVAEETGSDDVRAVIHCQGSTSFMMSSVAGLLPQVSTVVTNAVSLHPVVPPVSRFKSVALTPVIGALTAYLNPQWGLNAPTPVAKGLDLLVRATHHECDNAVCRWASFTYGTGFPTLWAHENLNEETHEWIKEEFAHVPVSFFEQMSECITAGHLVSVEGRPELPDSFVAGAPQTDARFAFLTGENNRCFLPHSQKRTFDFFERHGRGRHSFHVLPGYGHLDPFLGKDAAQDVFPLIARELEQEAAA